MYQIVVDMIGYTGTSEAVDLIIVAVCAVTIMVLTYIFIDGIFDIFRRFWR